MIAPIMNRALRQPRGACSLWEMLTLKAELFVSAISELASVRQILSQSFESQPDIIRKEILDLLAGLSSHLKTLDAKITKMAVDELTGNLSTDAVHTIDELRRSLDDIDATFRRELTDTGLIVLNSLEAALFAPTYPLFGVDVATKFPSVNYEIAEAGKCLA